MLETWCLRQIDELMSPGAPVAQVNVKYSKVTGVKSSDETNDIQSYKDLLKGHILSFLVSILYDSEQPDSEKNLTFSPGTQHRLSF